MLANFKKDLLENDFVHEKCPITVLNSSVEFYKSLEIGLTSFGFNLQKIQKKLVNRKRKKKKRKKNMNLDPRGVPFRPRLESSP
jgi:hypothetical protein